MFLKINPFEINVEVLNCFGHLPSTIGDEHLNINPRNKHIHMETQPESLVHNFLDAQMSFR